MELQDDIIKKVENDLRAYPDWLIRIEMSGLGTPSNYGVDSIKGNCFGSSCVEWELEMSEETKRKVRTIDRIHERLRGKSKDLIEYRYFQGYARNEVLMMLQISKRKYYTYRDRALGSFARGLGYIE